MNETSNAILTTMFDGLHKNDFQYWLQVQICVKSERLSKNCLMRTHTEILSSS